MTSPLESARGHLLGLMERFAAEREDEPSWLAGLRRRSAGAFAEQGLPSTSKEEWRYTNVAPIARVPFELPDPGEARVDRAAVEAVAFPVFACSLHVFVDGRYESHLSALGATSEVHVESLAELAAASPERLEPYLGRLVDAKQHPFAALATGLFDDGAALFVGAGFQVDEPLHVVFASSGGQPERMRQPRLLVVAGAGSRVRIIQDHVTLGAAGGFTNCVSEVFVGRNAGVDLVVLQREADDAFHVANTAVHQDRDARFSCHTRARGGRLVRNDLDVTLAEEGADCTLRGLFVGSDDAVIDNHTWIDHAVPHGTSRELYKGILGGRARGVFRGRVMVRPGAQKTHATQANPNLLLSQGAEVDTKPQLEIHADDVKCSHGSSIGQLDHDALFYLRSRGLDEARARDVLTRGFAHEIMAGLPVAALAEGLDEPLDARLSAATGREWSP
jgi:Fe-S cluster assembly protein SufD